MGTPEPERREEIAEACRAILAREAKPTVPEVLPLPERCCSRPENSVGGSLHLVLEDGNVLSLCSRTQRLRIARDWDRAPSGSAA